MYTSALIIEIAKINEYYVRRQKKGVSGGGANELKAFEPAGFWLRFSAFIVDGIILSVPMYIIKSAFPQIAPFLNLIICALYFIVFISMAGKTPGKMFFGLKIVRSDLKPVGWKESILRFICTILSQILFFGGYIIMLWDKNRQTLHDKIAGTYVIIDK